MKNVVFSHETVNIRIKSLRWKVNESGFMLSLTDILEYGYAYDEIEEMLTDHSLIREALRDVKYIHGDDVDESYFGAFQVRKV